MVRISGKRPENPKAGLKTIRNERKFLLLNKNPK